MLSSAHLRYSKILYWICFILLFLGLGKVVYEAYLMSVREWAGFLHSDVLIYLTVGRGMLNGHHMYTDLFESKPPGVFLLSALSLILSNGTGFMYIVQLGSLFLLPVILGTFVWVRQREYFPTLLTFVFGGVMSLWLERMCGGLQTELFAVLPMTVYACNMLYPGMSKKRIVLSALCIAWAVGFKEPYIIGIFVAAALCARDLRHFLECFLYPAILGGLMFILVLLGLGVLPFYFHTYLPGMIGGRIQAAALDPMYLRILWSERLFTSFTTYSSVYLLGFLLVPLWIVSMIREEIDLKLLFTLIIASIGGAAGFQEYYVLFDLFLRTHAYGLSPWQVLTDGSFWWISVLYVVGTISYLCLLVHIFRENKKTGTRLVIGLGIIPLLNLAIGVGGYQRNYLLFTFPAIIVLFLMFLPHKRYFMLSFVVFLMGIMFSAPTLDIAPTNLQAHIIRASAQLDIIMDKCGFKEYVFDGAGGILAFSKYSPVGPLFETAAHDYLGLTHPLYLETFSRMGKAHILVKEIVAASSAYNLFPDWLFKEFNRKVPLCAQGLTMDGFALYFK